MRVDGEARVCKGVGWGPGVGLRGMNRREGGGMEGEGKRGMGGRGSEMEGRGDERDRRERRW